MSAKKEVRNYLVWWLRQTTSEEMEHVLKDLIDYIEESMSIDKKSK